MKKFLTAVIAGLAFLSSFGTTPVSAAEEGPWVDPKRFTIENDGGGVVNDFKAALEYFKKEKLAVSVSGYCASACTLILSKDYNLDVCVKPDVRFGIHKPFFMDMLGVPANKLIYIYKSELMWKNEFLGKYPEWLQKAIAARGDVPAVIQGDAPNELMWFSYDDVRAFMRTCVTREQVESK